MADYASIKAPAATRQPVLRQRVQPAALGEAQQAAVEANRAFVREHLPEIEPMIRALYAEGLIDGWRAIKHCTLNESES